MARSTYMGQPMGFVQGTYFDQMGTALPGDLAYASDINLVDTGPVVNMPQVDGVDTILQCGLAASLVLDTGAARPGAPVYGVTQLTVTGTSNIIVHGVTARSQVVRTDAGLRSGWFNGDMATFVSGDRVGGRMWVRVYSGATANAIANVITHDTTGHGQAIGTFTGASIAGDTNAATNARFRTTAPAGGLALLEIIAQ